MSIELEREDVVQRLCAAYAHDQLTTGELEARLERAYKSSDRTQLLTVLDGLPAVRIARLGDPPTAQAPANGTHASPPSAAPYAARPSAAPAAASSMDFGGPVETSHGRGLAPGTKRFTSFFSELKKEGAWSPSRRIEARVIMGSILFDLRGATIPPEGIEFELDVIMGDAKIILPPGLGAEVDCWAALGGVADKADPALPGAPPIRVRGGAMMGQITVVTKVPRRDGESRFKAQLRSWLGTGE